MKMGLKVADVRALIAEGQEVDKLARDILVEGLRSLALCEANDFQNQMEKLSSAGVRYAAFLPAVETVEEHDKLSSLVSS